MKHKHILLVSVFLFTVRVMAEDSHISLIQSGDSNNVTLDSTGESNTLLVNQDGSSLNADLSVNGTGNRSSIKQLASHTSSLEMEINGEQNDTAAHQTGSTDAFIRGIVNGQGNALDLDQSGSHTSSMETLIEGNDNIVNSGYPLKAGQSETVPRI